MWKLGGADDKIRLRQDDIAEEELSKVLLSMTREDPSGPPNVCLPLYHRDDGEKITAAMPIFDEFGPVPTGPPPSAASLVNLSSGDRSSEATEEEGEVESSAPKQGEFLHNFSDNNDEDVHSVVELARPTGVTMRSGVAS